MNEGVYVQESAGQLQPPAPTSEQEAERTIVQEVIECLKFAQSYEHLQRQAEEEELAFEGEDMWLSEHRTSRAAHDDLQTGEKIPAKPTISVNLLDQNLQQIINEARQARLALTVKPKAGLANTKVAGYFKGLIRAIQVESGALAVRLWALERTARVGRGGYRITADFANDGDFDLDLIIERILDYGTIYWDPYSTAADRSNAEWNIETDWMAESTRLRNWPTKPLIPPVNGFEAEGEWSDWFAADTESPHLRRVRIATYRKVVHTTRTLAFHPQIGTMLLEEMPPALAEAVKTGAPDTRTREVDQRSVMIYICDGTQILEEKPWHGRYIPVIETIGKEYYLKCSGRWERRWKGVIANGMDLLRAINTVISAAVEIGGAMPRSPYIMIAGQDTGFEPEWDELFTANRSRVHVNAVDVDGKPAGFPQRQQTEIQIQGLMFLLRMLHDMYHAVTGSVAPHIRAVNPQDRSGKALDLMMRQGAAGTSNYLDNLATISMPYEGKVLIDAIPHYYDTPGRILRVMGEENDDETAIMIRRPFIRGAEGEPVAVPCQTCEGTGTIPAPLAMFWRGPATCGTCQGSRFATKETMPPEWQGKSVEYVDFGEGVYKVQAVLDRSFQTKQEEALAGMEMLMKAAPQLVPLYADVLVRAMGFSGSNEVADRLKPPQADEELQDLPPAARARFQHLQQQHQQAMAALGEAQKLLETDAIKAAGQKEIAVIRAGLQAKLEQIKVHGKMLQMGTEQQHDTGIEVLRGKIEGLQQEAQHRHEVMLQLLKELGGKETERHAVALHDQAAAQAEARLEGREVRAEGRDRVREDRTAAREDARLAQDRTHEMALTREQVDAKARLAAQAAETAARHAP